MRMFPHDPVSLPIAARLFLVAFCGLIAAVVVGLALSWPEQHLNYELTLRGEDDCLGHDGGGGGGGHDGGGHDGGGHDGGGR